MERYIMLACENIREEVLQAAREAGTDFPIIFLPAELHNLPDKLRACLQDYLNRLENVTHVLLPMGMCGNGTLGLKTDKASIVLPNCSDCIDLLISDRRLTKERPSRWYFLTGSWLDGQQSLSREFEHTIEKYGEKRGKRIIKAMYENYERFSLVDTGTYDIAGAAKIVEPLAEMLGVETGEMPGPFGPLRRMLALDFTDEFIIIPPGEEVTRSHFYPGM